MKPRQSRLLRWPLLTAGLLSLSGCAEGQSEPAVNACKLLALPAYTAVEQSQVADEMDAAPQSARWPTWVEHYVRLRQEVRACAGSG